MSDLVPRDNNGALQANGPQGAFGHGPQPLAGQQVEDTIDLRELIDVLRRNKRLIIAITLLFTVLAAIIVKRQVAEYRAEGVFRLQDERQALSGQLGAPGMEQVL